MDVAHISSFFNLSSPAVEGAAVRSSTVKFPEDESFGTFLDAAVKQVNETNTYLKQEEEELNKVNKDVVNNMIGDADVVLNEL